METSGYSIDRVGSMGQRGNQCAALARATLGPPKTFSIVRASTSGVNGFQMLRCSAISFLTRRLISEGVWPDMNRIFVFGDKS